MAENDIYDSQGKYERFKAQLATLCEKPKKDRVRIYHCQNPKNLRHFQELFRIFDSKDTSYVRRLRLLMSMKLICYAATKDLKECQREDMDEIVAFMHTKYKSSKSKHDFIRDLKYVWKLLFAETDDKGRRDDTIYPYPVRHLNAKVDKSREKRRNDKLTWQEYEKLVAYFATDRRVQAYITLAVESLARPQELLYLKIRDVEQHESYARISISEHGKEGIGWLQCIDSYPYILKWLEVHPLIKNPNAFLFISMERTNYGNKLRPESITKKLRTACLHLGIDKRVTGYSLKRNGVTFRRLRGESDLEIMHAARWTSTQQLKIYDLSEQDDAFKIALAKRGLIKDDTLKHNFTNKECWFCHKSQAFCNEICESCKRPLDRTKLAVNFSESNNEFAALANDPKLMGLLRKLAQNPELLQRIG